MQTLDQSNKAQKNEWCVWLQDPTAACDRVLSIIIIYYQGLQLLFVTTSDTAASKCRERYNVGPIVEILGFRFILVCSSIRRDLQSERGNNQENTESAAKFLFVRHRHIVVFCSFFFIYTKYFIVGSKSNMFAAGETIGGRMVTDDTLDITGA